MAFAQKPGKSQTNAVGVLPPNIPSAAELFDAIMGKIDPRFTLAGQKIVIEKMLTATPDEHARILKDFRKALAAYDVKSQEYFSLLDTQVTTFTKHAAALAHAN